MYGQGGGGFGGGWNQWGGAGGSMNNSNFQGQQAQQQQQMRSSFMNQGTPTGQINQFQGQQQAGSMMGFGGMGGGGNNMMGMMGYGGSVNTLGMGMGSNANPQPLMGMTGSNANQQSLMGMTGGNINSFGMTAANPSSASMGMNMGMGNAFVNNPFAQQQNAYLQQQQQQNSSQSIYQTQTGFPRPQPPLPPGPPPPPKDPPARALLQNPLFNNNAPQGVPPPLPVTNNAGSRFEAAPPPPPPPKEAPNSGFSKQNQPPPPPPPLMSNSEPQIPESVLQLLKNAETARQFQQATEALSFLSPLMKINVSQDLFGINSDDSKKGGIPGLDFTEKPETVSGSHADVKNQEKVIDEKSKHIERVNLDDMQPRSGDRKLDQKPSAAWNEGRKTWRDYHPQPDTQQQVQAQSQNKDKIVEEKQPEIVWELRSEIEKAEEKEKTKEVASVVNDTTSKTKTETLHEKNNSENEKPADNQSIDTQGKPNGEQRKDSSPSGKPVTDGGSDNGKAVSTAAPASIPLGSADGKPVEYDRKTLKMFDKKFREWEKQFENWKTSNQNHPDRDAYKQYMDQWNLWRQQLIEQRRFIIDSMNKARLEGNELAIQKSIAQETAEGSFQGEEETGKLGSNDNDVQSQGPLIANKLEIKSSAPNEAINNNPTPNMPISARLATLASAQSCPPRPGPGGVGRGAGESQNFQNQRSSDSRVNINSGNQTPAENTKGTSQNNDFQNQRLLDNSKAVNMGISDKQNFPNQRSLDNSKSGSMGGNQNFQNQRSFDNSKFGSMGGSMNFQNQKAADDTRLMGSTGIGAKKAPPPPSLMSMTVEFDAPIKKFEETSDSIGRSDRVVERIPRDRDRPFMAGKAMPDQEVKHEADQRRNVISNDRVARDPHPQEKPKSLFSQDINPWAVTSDPDKNPFEEAQRMQNPFMQASAQNPFAWGQQEDNLPTLSGFLQRDSLNSNQVLRTSVMPNQSNFTAGSTSSSTGNSFRNEMQSEHKMSGLQGVSFEPNAKGMPLLTVSKAQAVQPIPETIRESDSKTDVSQWFTRDRRGGFEDDISNEEPQDDYEDDSAPAVIDYGHGSGTNNEEDEYDLPRCEREQRDYDDYDEDEEPKDVVTIDYGHGSASANSHGYPYTKPAEEEYYEEEYYDEYAGGDDDYSGYPSMHSRGRGMPLIQLRERNMSMAHTQPGGRGMAINHNQSFGRGRGTFPGERFGTSQPFRPTASENQGYGYSPQIRGAPPLRGFHPDLSRAGSRPVANRGAGRGGPVRFPVPDAEGQIGRSLLPKPLPNEHNREEETERVSSPEIMILSPSKEPRRAPPRDSSADRRKIPRDSQLIDRVPRDSERVERVPRDLDRVDRDPNRANDSVSRRRDRSRDSEERYRSSGRDNSRENEDRNRSGRYPRDEERRVRRDPSPSRRDRDRERDRDSRDRYSKPRRRSRSRSRSPNFDRVAIYSRNPLGPPPGSTNMGLHSVNPPAPRYQTVLIEDILNRPGRSKRPSQIVIILRGLPGSGKTHVAKLIKDREVEMGGSAPRILSLDDYFMVEKAGKDPVTGEETKETVMEYEYEPDLEPKYRNDLIKTFKKTVENGFFEFIIVDGVNDIVRHFEDMVTYATQRRFQVYIAEVEESVETCAKRNIHHRTKDQIQKLFKTWERLPANYVKLDVRTLLQDEAVQDVEMEDVSDTENVEEDKAVDNVSETSDAWEKEEEEVVNDDSQMPATSKWETLEPSEEKLNRLDGLARKKHSGEDDGKVDSTLTTSIDSWLQSHLPEDYTSRQQTRPGQKRVRWADIEEKRAQERMRDVGFVVGHTDWNRMTDPTFGSSALTKTKYI